jgi:hypothetical protein
LDPLSPQLINFPFFQLFSIGHGQKLDFRPNLVFCYFCCKSVLSKNPRKKSWYSQQKLSDNELFAPPNKSLIWSKLPGQVPNVIFHSHSLRKLSGLFGSRHLNYNKLHSVSVNSKSTDAKFKNFLYPISYPLHTLV